MELNDQPMTSPEQGRGYPQSRFNALLVLLAIILIIVGVAQFTGTRAVEPSAVSEPVLQGDVAAKTAYVYANYLGAMGRSQALDLAEQAFHRFEREARIAPSPDVYRRLIILSPELVRKDTAGYIDQFARLKVSPARRAERAQEVAMWRAIYVSREVPRDRVQAYERRIRGQGLGWYEHISLNRLYTNAGMPTQARAQQELAKNEALRTLVLLGILVFVIIVLGLTGLGLLVWYARKTSKGEGSADLPSASVDPAARSMVAGHLLEAFVAYMVVIVVVQLVGGLVLDAADVRLSAMGEVIATVAAYVLSGLIALSILAKRLSASGMTWADIGLRSRRPFADVLWGIGAYAAALPLVLLTAVVVQWISRYIPSPENPIVPLFIESESWIAKLALFLLAVVAAPFFEELFFRGVLFNSMRAKWGLAAGALISAVVFGLVHPLPIGLLPILVLGAVFAVVFHERGSLLPSMIAHACNNAVAFALLFILAG